MGDDDFFPVASSLVAGWSTIRHSTSMMVIDISKGEKVTGIGMRKMKKLNMSTCLTIT